jgi:hypothetical protein
MASTNFVDGTTPVIASWLNDVNAATYTGKFGTGALLGGLTNPIISASLGANNYVQNYIYNPTNGTSASADFAAYANNSTPTTGFADMGFTSQTYADANYTVTGQNEAYLFGSAPSGSGKTGNLVLATDSTGTANAIQFYTGGFNQSKVSYKMQIDSTGVTAPALFTTTQTAGDNSTKVATTAFVTTAVAGVSTPKQIQTIGASVAANALTVTASALSLDFRSTALTSGTVTTVAGTPSNLVIPSGATLGTVSTVQSDLIILALNNAGTIELAVVNIAGGNDLSETGVISTTAISAGATSASTIYSTTARTGVAYRVIGLIRSIQTTAGTWATAPSLIQGAGGNALDSMMSVGYGQTYQDVLGSRALGTTYYNTTGKPIIVVVSGTNGTSYVYTPTVNGLGLSTNGWDGNSRTNVSFVVPVGASYSVAVSGTGTLNTWRELR